MPSESALENRSIELPSGGTATLRSRMKLAVKIIAVVGLLGLLGYKGALSVEKTKQALLDWRHVGPAFGLMMLTMVLGMVRWQWLLQAQGIFLPFSRTA